MTRVEDALFRFRETPAAVPKDDRSAMKVFFGFEDSGLTLEEGSSALAAPGCWEFTYMISCSADVVGLPWPDLCL